MMRRSYFLMCVMLAHLLVTFCPFAMGQSQYNRAVPVAAQVQDLRVKVKIGNRQRAVTVLVAPTETDYWLFPPFAITSASVSYPKDCEDLDEGYSDPVPLFDKSKRVTFEDDQCGAQLKFEIVDLLQTDAEQEIYVALSKANDPAVMKKERQRPQMSAAWRAGLEIEDTINGGSVEVGSRVKFERDYGQKKKTLTFILDKSEVRSLRSVLNNATVENFRLILSGSYTAEAHTTEYRLKGQYLIDETKSVLNRVTSQMGDQPSALFVPVGGDAQQRFDFKALFQKELKVQLERRAGVTVDPEVQKIFLSKMMDTILEQVKLSGQESGTVVTFLLSNGVKLSTPLGKLNSVADSLLTETESKTHEMFSDVSKSSQAKQVGGEAGASFLGLFSFGGSGAYSYNNQSASEQQRVRDNFRRDLRDAKKMVTGEIPIVSAMRLEQYQQIMQEGYFKTLLESTQFEDTIKELTMPFAIDPDEITLGGTAETTPAKSTSAPASPGVNVPREAGPLSYLAQLRAARQPVAQPQSFEEGVRTFIEASYNKFKDILGPAENAKSIFHESTILFPAVTRRPSIYPSNYSAFCLLTFEEFTELGRADDYYRMIAARVAASLPAGWSSKEVAGDSDTAGSSSTYIKRWIASAGPKGPEVRVSILYIPSVQSYSVGIVFDSPD